MIVASIGLNLVKIHNATEPILEEYKRNLTQLVQPIDSLSGRGTQVLWKLLEDVDQKTVKISNSDIDAYNRAAMEVSSNCATYNEINIHTDT